MVNRIYVASSWRNEKQPDVVAMLRRMGHEVYDFRNPAFNAGGFSWRQMDPDWETWSPGDFRDRLQTDPVASHGYVNDLRALEWCDTCVLVMPCGRSAHLELGVAKGRGKRTIILLSEGEPELMYLLADDLVISMGELADAVGRARRP